MTNHNQTRRLLALFIMLLPFVLAAEPAPLLPLEDFFRNPDKTGYAISPDGTQLAFLAPYESRLNINVREVGAEEARRITSETDRDIVNYFWVNDSRIAYFQDKGGDENARLFAVDLDGSHFKTLTPEGVRAGLIDELKDDPAHVLISLNERDSRLFDVYKLNLDTGDRELVVENPGNFASYATDHDGVVRIAMASDGVNVRVLYRETQDDDWTEVLFIPWTDEFNIVNFTYDNKQVWAMSSLGRDKSALVQWDPATREETEVIFSHPQVDLLSAHFSDERKKLTAVSFLAGYRTFVFFDDATERMQRSLEQRLAPLQVRLVDHSRDETKWLVATFSDRDFGSYYQYDSETDTLTHLSDQSPWIDPDNMAEMRPICYESRDGLFIHAYLTLPKGVPAKNLPLVVHPHGGPQARDSWGFRPEPQFLANRGYAVLQPNFRGSTGYGKQFMRMGFHEWGKKMQDDLTDGVNYLVDLGIVDPARVGIFGASYGGYATLAGLAFTPDVYAAGVSYVGPSNLFTLINSIPPYWEPFREQLYEMVGNPETDVDFLHEISPLFSADRIDDPLMILQGANDPRVKQAESDQIVANLRTRGVPVPYMLKSNEGHGFSNQENQFDANRAVEQFFAEYLGGRKEDAPDILEPLYHTPVELEKAEGTGNDE